MIREKWLADLASFRATLNEKLRTLYDYLWANDLAHGWKTRFAREHAAANSNVTRWLGQLDKAIENYTTVLTSSTDEMVKQKAVFGMARAHESLNQLERARAEYKQLADWKNCGYSAFAKQRYEDLAKPATKEWYAWFAKQDPRPPVVDGPGTPGQKPSFETAQPSGPDINLPAVGSGLLNDPEGAKPATGPDAGTTAPPKSP